MRVPTLCGKVVIAAKKLKQKEFWLVTGSFTVLQKYYIYASFLGTERVTSDTTTISSRISLNRGLLISTQWKEVELKIDQWTYRIKPGQWSSEKTFVLGREGTQHTWWCYVLFGILLITLTSKLSSWQEDVEWLGSQNHAFQSKKHNRLPVRNDRSVMLLVRASNQLTLKPKDGKKPFWDPDPCPSSPSRTYAFTSVTTW